MQATFKIPVKNLNPAFIKEMQEKYAGAELEITVKRNPDFNLLEEEQFWEIIDLLDWEQEADADIIEPVVAKLAAMSVAHIYQFQDILSEKLYRLDQRQFAEHIGDRSYQPGKYFSVDGFLYIRACVVANGREIYEEVLKDPGKMPKGVSFEPVLYVATKAYKRKTGREFIYIPLFDYETYSNEKGWEENGK